MNKKINYLISLNYKGNIDLVLDNNEEVYESMFQHLLMGEVIEVSLESKKEMRSLFLSIAMRIRRITSYYGSIAELEFSLKLLNKTNIIFYKGRLFVKNNILSIFKDIDFDASKYQPNHGEVMEGSVFYSKVEPLEIEGWIVNCVDSIGLYKYEKIPDKKIGVDFRKEEIHKMHRTHYLKWEVSEDMSIRYFIQFQDSPEKENLFFIKSHSAKMYIPITEKEAEKLISEMATKEVVEIIGWMYNGKYKKLKFCPKDEIHNEKA